MKSIGIPFLLTFVYLEFKIILTWDHLETHSWLPFVFKWVCLGLYWHSIAIPYIILVSFQPPFALTMSNLRTYKELY